MRLSDLITDPMLRLELATPSSASELNARVTSAIATESIDPSAYLRPGTLVLTTGMGFNFGDPRIWDGYVERLLGACSAGLAFGLGKPHTSVPAGLMDSARRFGFPVLAVPKEVPFLHLQNLVHRALAEEDFQASRLGWRIAEECTSMSAAGQEIESVLDHVASRADVILRIVDDDGVVFALGDPNTENHETAVVSLPLPLDEDFKWRLQCSGGDGSMTDAQLRTVLAPAAAVLGMMLSRVLGASMWESDTSQRLLAALVRTDEGGPQAVDSAFRQQGINIENGARLISVLSSSPTRLHRLAWRLIRLLSKYYEHVIPMEPADRVLLLVPLPTQSSTFPSRQGSDSQVFDEIKGLTDASGDSGVLISEPLRSAGALSLFIALHGTRSPNEKQTLGVRVVGSPQLKDVMHLIPPMFTSAIAESLLGPVLTSNRSPELLNALAVFIDSPSLARAAVRLKIHRNTARAHRNELEEQLGINLESGADRTMCALALASLNR